MKRTLAVVTLFWIWFAPAGQTVFKINQYNVAYRGDVMPVFTMFTNARISKTLSITGYFYINAYPKGSWGEGLAGLSYTPASWVTIGFLGGFQTNEPRIWRISPILLLNYKKWSFFGGFEFGGARYRWDAMGFYQIGAFRLGGEFIRYYKMYAAGPRAEFTFCKKQPVTLFYSFLWDWTYGHPAHMFGIYTTFGGLRQGWVTD